MPLYLLTVFLSSGLFFAIQPLLSKMLLPVLGGAPAVWTTCVLYFQIVLLVGYGYCHWLTRFSIRTQAVIHVALGAVAIAGLPAAVGTPRLPPSGWPVGWTFRLLTRESALPLVFLAAASPLLQHWLFRGARFRRRNPYPLYAIGSLGTLAALLAYPLAIESRLSLSKQSAGWSWLFALAVLLTGACGWTARQASARCEPGNDRGLAPLGWARRGHWIVLAFVPSALLLALTTRITVDLAPIPLLWVLPLGLYMLTFFFAFSRRFNRLYRFAEKSSPGAILFLIYSQLSEGPSFGLLGSILIQLYCFFLIALVCHKRLALRRPAASRLTHYYLFTSLGGILGGFFNVVIAPLAFRSAAEFPISILAVCLVVPRAWGRRFLPRTSLLRLGITGAAALCFWWNGPGPGLLHAERSFFGVLQVADENGLRILFHGTTVHGIQSRDAKRGGEPLSYYSVDSPVGQLLAWQRARKRNLQIGAVGLGVGTLAAYVGEGQRITFYEIDPKVEWIAQSSGYFSYLADARRRGAQVSVVTGDARLMLRQKPPAPFDVLVTDAFNSDVIPLHLLTREALHLYLADCAPDGVLAFHITNRYVNLKPVLAGLARDLGLTGWTAFPPAAAYGAVSSEWVLLARDPATLSELAGLRGWKKLPEQTTTDVWTDDFTSLLPLLSWPALL